MEVLASNKTSAEIKVDEIILYFALTEKGVWRSAAGKHCRGSSTWVEGPVFDDARNLAIEAIASHYFAPMNKATMVELVLSSMRRHNDVDVAVEAIFLFLSKKIPPYDFLKSYIGREVKKILGAKSKKRAEERRKQGQAQTEAKQKKDRQLALLL